MIDFFFNFSYNTYGDKMKLLEQLHIKTDQESLYKQAFTHTSYANEHGLLSYERLEYLGDAILELFISDYLYQNTDYDEGIMTKMRAHYVCEDALYEYSLKLKMNDELLLGKGEAENGGKYRKAIVADIFEAFIGALYLDQGLEVVNNFLNMHMIPMIENHQLDFIKDYKSVLQELVQTDKKSLEYVLVKEEGPAHHKTFTVEVWIDQICYGEGVAHSKKEAEQNAAKNALKKAQDGKELFLEKNEKV